MFRLVFCALLVFTAPVQARHKPELNKAQKIAMLKEEFLNLREEIKILPEIAKCDCGIYAVAPLNIPDKFACADGGSFAYATVAADYSIKCQKANDKFPRTGVSDFQADETGTIMWGRDGYRGLIALSVPDKTTIDTIPADGNLYGGVPFLSKNFTVLLANMKPGGFGDDADNSFFIAYDMKTGKRLYDNEKTGPFFNNIYHVSGTRFLGEKWISSEDMKTMPYSEWYWVDITETGFSKPFSDRFTETLTHKKVQTGWQKIKRVDFGKRFLIGNIFVDDGKWQFVSVRWDKDFNNIKIDPLVAQCPAKYGFGDGWNVSPDGKWLCAEASVFSGNVNKYISVFYNIDGKYPQGVSLPIFGSSTDGIVSGCFVNHSVLGPLYVALSSKTSSILIYKLNDALKLLK